MKSKWQILYYETAEGESPVEKFIDARKDRDQAKIFSWISLLEEQGPNLPRPYKEVKNEIF